MTHIRNEKGQFVSAAGRPREHGRFVKAEPKGFKLVRGRDIEGSEVKWTRS